MVLMVARDEAKVGCELRVELLEHWGQRGNRIEFQESRSNKRPVLPMQGELSIFNITDIIARWRAGNQALPG